ncbi:MAG: hypothetical protein IV090_18165 [Candidatus Sericytochromatia bacterium]|nr:hypothetical protein [Candidatus Sericytochromatia bacterium]
MKQSLNPSKFTALVVSIFIFTACQLPSVPGEAPKPDVELPSSKEKTNLPLKTDLNSKIENTALPTLQRPSDLIKPLPPISEETKSLKLLNESVEDILLKTTLAQDPYLNPVRANEIPAVMFTNQLQPQISAFQENKTIEGTLLTTHKSLINQFLKLLSQNEVIFINRSYISEKYTPVFPVAAIDTLTQSNQIPARMINVNNQPGLVLTHLGHKTTLSYLNFSIAKRAQFIFDTLFAPRLQSILQSWNTEAIAYLGFVISYRVEAPTYKKGSHTDAAITLNPDLDKFQTETALYLISRADLQALVKRELTYQSFLERLLVYVNSFQNQNLKIELD